MFKAEGNQRSIMGKRRKNWNKIEINKTRNDFQYKENDSQDVSTSNQKEPLFKRQAVDPETRAAEEQKENDGSAVPSGKGWEQDIRKPIMCFQDEPGSQLEESCILKKAADDKSIGKQKNAVLQKQGAEELQAGDDDIKERNIENFNLQKENGGLVLSAGKGMEQEIRKPIACFQVEPGTQLEESGIPKKADDKSIGKQKKAVSEKQGVEEEKLYSGDDGSALPVGKGMEQEIRKPIACFQDGTGSQLEESRILKKATTDRGIRKQKKAVPEKQGIEREELHEKSCINTIIDTFIQQELFICINGRQLFVKEDGAYVFISLSPEYEIMKLKALLKKYSLKLRISDYSVIIKHLKTEPDIWVKSLEPDGDGKYNISFHGGEEMLNVEGSFVDFEIQEQIQNKLKPFTEGILLFVRECCIIDGNARTESTKLFGAYENFMCEYPNYLPAKQNQFVPYIKAEYGLQAGSTGKARVLKGICLKRFG